MRIVHVSIYPDDRFQEQMGGVASYTRNLVQSIASSSSHELIVLSNTLQAVEQYLDGRVTVRRCFNRDFRFVYQLKKNIAQLNPEIVHIQQELNIFGGYLTAFLLPLLLFVLRKRTVIVTIHGVVSLSMINRGFVAIHNLSVPIPLIKVALFFIFHSLLRLSSAVVVHEDEFRRRLVTEYGGKSEKIFVVPHGVDVVDRLEKSDARSSLEIDPGKNVVFFIGYLTGYKGLDLLIEAFSQYSERDENAFLIIGAGEHPRFKDDEYYQVNQYQRLKSLAQELIPQDNYRWVGFVPEDQLITYFSAIDLCVFPYITGISSSGPMALSIGYGVPLIVSEACVVPFLDGTDLVVETSVEGICKGIERYFCDSDSFDDEICMIRNSRSWRRVAENTLRLYELELTNLISRP